MLDELPDELKQLVALFLPAKDILSILTVNRAFQELGNGLCFWKCLLQRETADLPHQDITRKDALATTTTTTTTASSIARIKRQFLIESIGNHDLTTIKWCFAETNAASMTPHPREGHSMCVLYNHHHHHHHYNDDDDDDSSSCNNATTNQQSSSSSSPQNNSNLQRIVLTSGWSNDARIHTLDYYTLSSSTKTTPPPRVWRSAVPTGHRPLNVYGDSLIGLDSTRAVRFGGMSGAGYRHECNHVYVLHTHQQQQQENDPPRLVAAWERIHFSPTDALPAPRAYHAATLLNNRYMYIVGGIHSHGPMLAEAILDVVEWKWIVVDGKSECVSSPDGLRPSPRLGHSIVLDDTRNRIVLFGGGNGNDLLRTGKENTEVWQLEMGPHWQQDLPGSLPWKWSLLHRDQANEDDDNEDDLDHANRLTPSQRLCLGKCHVGHKVSRDMVVLAFGSGHPSTNGVLGYHLKTDSFVSLGVRGSVPRGRMTCGSVVLPHEGWVLVHSGYSTQETTCLEDVVVMDLAPALNRSFGALPMTERPYSHRPVRDDDVHHSRNEQDAMTMLGELMWAAPNERRTLANRMLLELAARGALTGRAALILSMVANGHVEFQAADNDDDDDDDDDNVNVNVFDDDDDDDDDSDYQDDSEMTGFST